VQQFTLSVDGNAQSQFTIYKTTTWREKMRGLLWRRPLNSTSGLWLERCSSIHTVFMTYRIDVVFVDKQGIIKKICHAVKPWRMAFCLQGKHTVELFAGVATARKLQVGQVLQCGTLLATSEGW
jgi:uncharacterized protein